MKIMVIGLAVVLATAASTDAQVARVQVGCPCPQPCAKYSKHATSCGYWTVRQESVYVPGHWTWWQHPCGQWHKKWVPGCWRTVSRPVWVPVPPPQVCRR